MKLTIEHLAPYLPYGLELMGSLGKSLMTVDENFEKKESIGVCLAMQRKPILRPLSDLTKEINHNGEKFVPEKWIGDFIKKENNYSNYDTSWIRSLQYKNDISKWSYWLHIKLFEWHFDVFGLIEKGLAIDIKTLES